MLPPMNIHHFLFAFDGKHICWFLSRSSSVLPYEPLHRPLNGLSAVPGKRGRERDGERCPLISNKYVICIFRPWNAKPANLSLKDNAARPFSWSERRLGPSSSLCDHGSVLYTFEIIWIIWFAWLNPNLLNRPSLTFGVQTLRSVCVVLSRCLYVCNCLLMCVLFSLTSSCLSSSGAPIRKLPWQLAALQLSCCDGCTGGGKRPEGQKWLEGWEMEVTVALLPDC